MSTEESPSRTFCGSRASWPGRPSRWPRRRDYCIRQLPPLSDAARAIDCGVGSHRVFLASRPRAPWRRRSRRRHPDWPISSMPRHDRRGAVSRLAPVCRRSTLSHASAALCATATAACPQRLMQGSFVAGGADAFGYVSQPTFASVTLDVESQRSAISRAARPIARPRSAIDPIHAPRPVPSYAPGYPITIACGAAGGRRRCSRGASGRARAVAALSVVGRFREAGRALRDILLATVRRSWFSPLAPLAHPARMVDARAGARTKHARPYSELASPREDVLTPTNLVPWRHPGHAAAGRLSAVVPQRGSSSRVALYPPGFVRRSLTYCVAN